MRKKAKLLVMLLVMVLSLGMLSITASAATKKIPFVSYTAKVATIKKKAVTVKKGTTTLKFAARKKGFGEGFIVFKAPKKGTYTFKFSDIKPAEKGTTSVGLASFHNLKDGFLEMKNNVSTKGGKTAELWMATSNIDSSDVPVKEHALKTRTGTVKLKKNEVVYIYLMFTPKDSVKLKIASK